MFEEYAEVITEDFRTVHRLADAFFFGSMRTSAFSIALCTQKPIVAMLMDEEPAMPFADALALLARRVAIISAKTNDCVRVVFDSTALTEALAQAQILAVDTSFLIATSRSCDRSCDKVDGARSGEYGVSAASCSGVRSLTR